MTTKGNAWTRGKKYRAQKDINEAIDKFEYGLWIR